MSITYPAPEKPNPYPKPVLAPTPKLRGEAAIDEAIGAFKSMTRAAAMIGVLLIYPLSIGLSGSNNYAWPIMLGLFVLFVSLFFAAADFTPASKRAKYLSGVNEDQLKPDLFGWVRWGAFFASFGLGFGFLFGYKALGLGRSDATALFSIMMIIGQLIAILMDMVRGVRLLRFAQAQLASDARGND